MLCCVAVKGFPRASITSGQRVLWTVEVNAIGSNEPRQGKKRLAGDTARVATTDEVKDLRREARDLKADGLHLSEDHRVGMVLSQHDPGRLQPLHHLVEALH